MKLRDVYICIQCEEIYDHLRTMACGISDATICPSCASRAGVLLCRWIKTMAEYEKEETCSQKIESTNLSCS